MIGERIFDSLIMGRRELERAARRLEGVYRQLVTVNSPETCELLGITKASYRDKKGKKTVIFYCFGNSKAEVFKEPENMRIEARSGTQDGLDTLSKILQGSE